MFLQGSSHRDHHRSLSHGARIDTSSSQALPPRRLYCMYGAEAVLPTDLQYVSSRVQAYQQDAGKEAQKDTNDLLEESRDIDVVRSAGYQ
jgi:hypothetical protein